MHKNSNNLKIILLHKRLIKNKPYLHLFYLKAYLEIKKIVGQLSPIIELGSGAGLIKEVMPEAITSDVVKSQGIDRVFSAERLPFKNNSVRAFVMFSVMHHIKKPEPALREMQRCLKTNGKIVMIEPYNSLFSRFTFKNCHQEGFDETAGWEVKGDGRLTDAHLAMPWIIFQRDQSVFKAKFPNLLINQLQPHSAFQYLLTGGLSYDWSLPKSFYPWVDKIEQLLFPFQKYLGLFVTIELQKVAKSQKLKPNWVLID
jgi:SAM-dependent methyltransferase